MVMIKIEKKKDFLWSKHLLDFIEQEFKIIFLSFFGFSLPPPFPLP